MAQVAQQISKSSSDIMHDSNGYPIIASTYWTCDNDRMDDSRQGEHLISYIYRCIISHLVSHDREWRFVERDELMWGMR